MSAVDSNEKNLRERQLAGTRKEIIDKAMELYAAGADAISHELIAREASMSTRTVYRHFPDRTALMQAVWMRLREIAQIHFPTREQDIVPLARQSFASLDEHALLVKGVMASVAGAQLQRLPAEEAVNAFTQSLGPLLKGLTVVERKRIVSTFVAIYSAPFWQLLRDRGGLNGKDAQESTAWLLELILQALHQRAVQLKEKEGKK